MKQILIVCLIGMGLLLPTAKVNSSIGHSFFHKRVVDVYQEGGSLLATSDAGTGTIQKIEIFRGSELMTSRSCSGYSCSISLSGLSAGKYTVLVTTSLTTYEEDFTI